MKSGVVTSTTFRIPDALLRQVQHECIDRGASQQDACIAGLRLWVEGWSEKALELAQQQIYPPFYNSLFVAMREAEGRGVTVSEVVTIIGWLGIEREHYATMGGAGELSAPIAIAQQVLRGVQRLIAALEEVPPMARPGSGKKRLGVG